MQAGKSDRMECYGAERKDENARVTDSRLCCDGTQQKEYRRIEYGLEYNAGTQWRTEKVVILQQDLIANHEESLI